MTKYLAILAAALMCSCASPRVAPRFDVPSTRPIAKGITQARSHVVSAKKKADKIAQDNPALKLQIVELTIDLDSALKSLDTAEGARKSLQEQLKQQTTKANKLADSYDKSQVEITSLKISRHRWVKYFTGASLLLVLAGAWIFRKPILMLVAGI